MALYLGDKLIATAADLANRLHFRGELTLEATRTNWQDLIPAKKAQVYFLVNDTAPSTSVKIDGETFSVGDWIIIMNDVATGETGVEVQKLTSSSDAIKIVDELPTADINPKVFYAIPTQPGFVYDDIKYRLLKHDSTNIIGSDGIYTAGYASCIAKYGEGTMNDDLYSTYFYEVNIYDARAAGTYLVTFYKRYNDGTVTANIYSNTTVPYEPNAPEWDIPVEDTSFSVYVYDEDKTEWDCIYPVEADAVKYVDDITTIPAPKETVLYGVKAQKDIKYYKMSDAQIAAGSTITASRITLLDAGVFVNMSDVAKNPSILTMTYGFTEVTGATANSNCVVTCTIGETKKAYPYASFEKEDKTQVYIYNGTTFEKIYPQEEVEDIVFQIELDQEEYEKVLDGTSTLYTYDKNAIYKITDPDHEDAPKAYLNGVNIMSNDAIIDVTTLPSSTTELAKVNRNSFYRTIEAKARYTNIEYYDLGGVYYIGEDPADPGVKRVAWNDATAVVNYGPKISELRESESEWELNKTAYDITATTSAAITSETIATYKDSTSTTPEKWIVDPADGLDLTQTVNEDQLYVYSEQKSDWICIYPSAVEFEDVDINFEDATEWYPIKP